MEFARFLISQNDDYNDFSAISFLKQMETFDHQTEITRQLARMQRRSLERVSNLAPAFEAFRFPKGIGVETVRVWSNARTGKDLLTCIERLVNPCHKTRIPYLSPHAQTLAHCAEKTLRSLKDDRTEKLSREDYRRRWELLIRSISGIELSRENVRNRFISIVSTEDRLKLLLRQSQRPKLIRQVAGDGSDREKWVLAKLIEAAGTLSPEDYSMCSICLGSGYLYDTEGRFCNRKTFLDFASFIDRDIQNLRAFIDPEYTASAASAGHVKRLMSFIREFLIDPQNAHYTNFEVYRTKLFNQG